MADERVFIRLTPENMITVGLLSMVTFFGLVLAKQVVRFIAGNARYENGGEEKPPVAPPVADETVSNMADDFHE